jgi:hypothetical protein
MSVTMPDPVNRLLHLPPPPVGPPAAERDSEKDATDRKATS